MAETVAAVLDAAGNVINTIVVDPSTVSDYSEAVVQDETNSAAVVVVVPEETRARGLGLGWKRQADGKFTPPPVETFDTEEIPDLVTQVVEDDRLVEITPENRVVLEEVLTEKIGRPTARPENAPPLKQ